MTGKWSCTRDGVQGIPLQTFARLPRAGLMGAALFHCGNDTRTAEAFEKANPVVAERGTVATKGMLRIQAGSYAHLAHGRITGYHHAQKERRAQCIGDGALA